MKIISKDKQAHGSFNNGEIVENKPIGFPQDGGEVKPFSNLFYWANARALKDSTIGLHPHQGFEIISFVLKGTIRHYDTQMDAWRDLHAGDVQIIRAGSGISHAEHMTKGSRMFQIWVDPDLSKTMSQAASYSDYKDSEFVSQPSGANSVKTMIGNDSHFELDAEGLSVELVTVAGQYELEADADQIAAVYVLDGMLTVGRESCRSDDFILIESAMTQFSGEGSLFIIKCLREPGYQTYADLMSVQANR